jgi:hypothetical protein
LFEFYAGLHEVLGAIPATKGVHLDEAFLRLRKPEPGVASYPFRPTVPSPCGEQKVGEKLAKTTSYLPTADLSQIPHEDDPTPGLSRPWKNTAISEKKKGTVTPTHSEFCSKYSLSAVPRNVIRFLD